MLYSQDRSGRTRLFSPQTHFSRTNKDKALCMSLNTTTSAIYELKVYIHSGKDYNVLVED